MKLTLRITFALAFWILVGGGIVLSAANIIKPMPASSMFE